MSDEPQHTPAPWGVASPMCGEVWIMAGHLHVASIPRAHDGDWSTANAKLVAAAPGLLGQHYANTAHLDLLRKAVESGDPLNELLIRIDDLIQYTNQAIKGATS